MQPTWIEIHMIHSLPPSNPNRDAQGNVKSTKFGGTLRTVLSSQSQKYTARQWYQKEGKGKPIHHAKRSREFDTILAPMLDTWEEEVDRITIARLALAIFNVGADKLFEEIRNKNNSNLVFLGNNEIEKLAMLIKREADVFTPWAIAYREYLELIALEEEIKELTKRREAGEAVEISENVKRLADFKSHPDKKAVNRIKGLYSVNFKEAPGGVALFGRMMASALENTVYGATQTAFALGVSEVPRARGIDSWGTGEIDFFSANDDLKSQRGEGGAGMIGEVRYSAPTFYRYGNVGLHLLAQTMGEEFIDDIPDLVAGYLEGVICTLPEGKGTSFAHHTLPEFVIITVKNSQPISLANAFEQAINGQDDDKNSVATQAVQRLLEWRDGLYAAYPRYAPVSTAYTALPGYAYGQAIVSLDENIRGAIKVGMQHLFIEEARKKEDKKDKARK
jgi:CRISPR system Cascade subunit CasC